MDSMDSEDYPSMLVPSPLLGMASLRLPDSEEYPFDSRRDPVNKEVSSTPSEVAVRHIANARHPVRHSNRGHLDASARSILDLFGEAVKDAVNVASSSMAEHNDTSAVDGAPVPGMGHGLGHHTTRLAEAAPYNRTSIEVELGDELLYRYSLTTSLVYFAAYLLVFAIGLVGNCFVIAVVFRSPRMRTVTNYFIVNLAVADILVIVFCLPATLMSSIFVPWVLGWWMCKCVSYVQGVSVVASVYSLIAVSLDRFLAIWYPLKCQITTRRARGMIVVIWLIACGTTIPWALFFDTVMTPIGEHHEIVMCREVWPNGMSGEMYFLVANLLCCYLVPLVLISLCYVLIWIKVWRRSIPSDSKDAQMERMQQKSKVKVVKMLVVVVILFVLSWAPLYIIFARVKLGGATSPWEDEVVAMGTPIAQWLGASNSCINPILYAFFNNKFRRGFQAILQSRRCCGRLRYYETVAVVGSSSASMRKSSYYVTSTRRALPPVVIPAPVGPAPGHDSAVSYICNNSAYIAASNTGV